MVTVFFVKFVRKSKKRAQAKNNPGRGTKGAADEEKRQSSPVASIILGTVGIVNKNAPGGCSRRNRKRMLMELFAISISCCDYKSQQSPCQRGAGKKHSAR